MKEAEDRLCLPGMRRAVAEVAGALPGLRRLELVRRGAPGAASRRGGAAEKRYALAAAAGPQLYADIDTVVAERLSTGDRRVRPRARRRRRAGIAGADRRRAGHRQVDAAAAGGGAFCQSVGPVLYCSGEESEHQIKSRGERLGVERAPLYILAETCLERILEEIARLRRRFIIVDSIQTVFSLSSSRRPAASARCGSRRRSCCLPPRGRTSRPSLSATSPRTATWPDPRRSSTSSTRCLYFEGEKHHAHRVVRAVKNRFGAVSELGVFEMTGTGLRAVPNPSQLFLAERAANAPGSAVLCCIEGSRPLLVEVQALVSSSTYGNARRMASGIDQNRLSLLLAVLEKRAGLNLIAEDVFVNVAGGMAVDEPAADLGDRGRGCVEPAQPRRSSPARRSLARSGSPARSAARARPRCACARPRRWASRAASCPTATVAGPADDAPAGLELVGVKTVGEALDLLIDW